MKNNLEQFTASLEKDDKILQALLQDLLAYEEHLSLLSEQTQDTLKKEYGVDLHAPVKVKEALEEILLKGW